MYPDMPARGNYEGVIEQPPVKIDRLHGPRGLVGGEKTVARGEDKVSGIPVGDLADAVGADLEPWVHPAVADEADAGPVAYPEPPLGVRANGADEVVLESVVVLVINYIRAAVIPVQAAYSAYPYIVFGIFVRCVCEGIDLNLQK